MIIRRCVPETEQGEIIDKCHTSSYGGHFAGGRTAHKILQSGFYWPTLFKDCFEWVKHYDKCQRMVNISRRNEMPLQGILVVQIFYVWGIDFMRPFPSSFGNICILLVVDCVSKSVEAISYPRNEANTVVRFVQRNILSRYGIRHVMGLAYHPQSNGQAIISNREIKKNLEKKVNTRRKDWFIKLDDALCAYKTVYKTPIGMSHTELYLENLVISLYNWNTKLCGSSRN